VRRSFLQARTGLSRLNLNLAKKRLELARPKAKHLGALLESRLARVADAVDAGAEPIVVATGDLRKIELGADGGRNSITPVEQPAQTAGGLVERD
jgi:hypothetical protein